MTSYYFHTTKTGLLSSVSSFVSSMRLHLACLDPFFLVNRCFKQSFRPFKSHWKDLVVPFSTILIFYPVFLAQESSWRWDLRFCDRYSTVFCRKLFNAILWLIFLFCQRFSFPVDYLSISDDIMGFKTIKGFEWRSCFALLSSLNWNYWKYFASSACTKRCRLCST